MHCRCSNCTRNFGTGVHMKVIDFLSTGLPLNATPKASEDLTLHALSEYPLLVIISTYMNDIDFSELINKLCCNIGI
jgi:hypothetical protein